MKKRPKLILVTGLYKSGTSLVTSLIEKMDYSNLNDLWDDEVIGITNEYLTHESRSVNNLNDKIISSFYSSSLGSLPSFWDYKLRNAILKKKNILDKIRNIISNDSNKNLVIKDPRFCLTIPLWLHSLYKMYSIKLVFVFRDKNRIIKSWFRDEWCIDTLKIKSEEDALRLSKKYEFFLFYNYIKFQHKYDSLFINLDFLRNEKDANIRLLLNFLESDVDVEKLKRIIK